MNPSGLSSGVARVKGRCESRQSTIKDTTYNHQSTDNNTQITRPAFEEDTSLLKARRERAKRDRDA
jgi:hypothetical protein